MKCPTCSGWFLIGPSKIDKNMIEFFNYQIDFLAASCMIDVKYFSNKGK